MHFYSFIVSLSLVFTESYSQGGYSQQQYNRPPFAQFQQGYQQPPPYWARPSPYRVIIRPLPLSPASYIDQRPLYGTSPSFTAPIFEDSPVIETASSGGHAPTHQSQGAAGEETVAQDSSTGGIAAEDFDAPIPVTETARESNSSLGIHRPGATAEEQNAQESQVQTRVVQGSGIEIAGGSTAEQTTLSEGSGAIEESVESETVAENVLTANQSANESFGQEFPEHSLAQDSVTDNRRDPTLRDYGRITEPINAANILFFNRSEIGSLCFQTSQNNGQNGRLQLAENAQVVAQCLMDTSPQPLICNPVDMLFVVDGSGSIGEQNFILMKNWIRQFINTYLDTGLAERQSQVGLIEFSDAAFVQVPLGGYTKEKLLTDIGVTPYQGGGTEIGLALNMACQEFSQEGRDRSFAKNIIILLTDGQSEDQRSIINGVSCAMSKNIDIVAIGIGNQFNQSQLEFITDHKANRLFSIANFIGLDARLADDLCKRITDVDTTTTDIRCPVPQIRNSQCSNTVVYEGNCAYTVTKCKLGCSSTQPRSQATRQINTGNAQGGFGFGGYGGRK